MLFIQTSSIYILLSLIKFQAKHRILSRLVYPVTHQVNSWKRKSCLKNKGQTEVRVIFLTVD